MNPRGLFNPAANPRIRKRFVRSLVGLSGLAFALFFMAAGPARGACVHGVSISSRLDREQKAVRVGARHFELLGRVGALADRLDERTAPFSGPDGGAPVCSGPFCDGRAADPLAPVPVDPPRPPQWAGLIAPPRPAPLASHPLPFNSLPFRPSSIAPSVFHPPRASSPSLALVSA